MDFLSFFSRIEGSSVSPENFTSSGGGVVGKGESASDISYPDKDQLVSGDECEGGSSGSQSPTHPIDSCERGAE